MSVSRCLIFYVLQIIQASSGLSMEIKPAYCNAQLVQADAKSASSVSPDTDPLPHSQKEEAAVAGGFNQDSHVFIRRYGSC
jgi:hypothetical protein